MYSSFKDLHLYAQQRCISDANAWSVGFNGGMEVNQIVGNYRLQSMLSLNKLEVLSFSSWNDSVRLGLSGVPKWLKEEFSKKSQKVMVYVNGVEIDEPKVEEEGTEGGDASE